MSQTVFILGAGASREAGGQLMANSLDIAEDVLAVMRQSQEADPVTESFDLVFRGIHKL
jgi:hypothetical protein